MTPSLALRQAEQIVQSMGFDARRMTDAPAGSQATNRVAGESPKLAYTWVVAADKSLSGSNLGFGSSTVLKDEAIIALESRVATFEEEVEMLKTELKERPIVATVPIYDLGSAEFDLRSPVTVLIEKYEEETVARFPELELHGIGKTEPEAMAYLKKDFVELYLDLESTPTNVMGRLPSRWWALLRKLVVKHGQAHS